MIKSRKGGSDDFVKNLKCQTLLTTDLRLRSFS